jgi:3-methyladenine DNA glycosylase AlkD
MGKTLIQKKTRELLERMAAPKKFIKELQKILESESERKRFEQIKRIIPEALKIKVFGTRHPVLNIIGDEIGKFGEKNLKSALEIVRLLWNGGSFEERIIAAKSLERIGKIDYKATLNLVISFSKEISDWAVCDTLAMSAMRFITPFHPKEVFSLAEKWIKDKEKWIRRLGVVSLLPLVREKKYHFSGEEFEIIKNLMKDSDKDVKKAVAWILREISKKDKNLVFKFLMEWAKVDNKNSQWIVRDGMKKLDKVNQEKLKSLMKW